MKLTLRENVECEIEIAVSTLVRHSAADAPEEMAQAASYFRAIQRQVLRSAVDSERTARAFLRHLLSIGLPANFHLFGPGHVSGSRTLLQFVARKGLTGCVEELLKHQADATICTDFGRSPLHLSAWSGVTSCVEAVLRSGVLTPSTVTSDSQVGFGDKAGWTPVHCASHVGAPVELAEALVAVGFSPNEPTLNGTRPFHLALDRDWGGPELPDCLLRHGAVLCAVANDGWNALHRACRGRHAGSIDAVRYLLARGIPIDGPTQQGRTAVEIAHRANQPEIFAVLVASGAKLSPRLPAAVRRSPSLGGSKRGDTLPMFPLAEVC